MDLQPFLIPVSLPKGNNVINITDRIKALSASLEETLVQDVEQWRKTVVLDPTKFNALEHSESIRFLPVLTKEILPTLITPPNGHGVIVARTILLTLTGIFIFYDAFISKDKIIYLVPVTKSLKNFLPSETHCVLSDVDNVIAVNGGVLNISNFYDATTANIYKPEEFIENVLGTVSVRRNIRRNEDTENLLRNLCDMMQLDECKKIVDK